jgi:riboflavin kinase / FMN adenylyltransferase
MIVHNGYEDLNIRNPAVTLGIFDGVHIGHKALISRLVNSAKNVSGESVIITFNPHPRLVLTENTGFCLLNSPEEKISLLEKEGVDHLIVIPFDHEFSNKEACEFIEEVLVNKIGAKHLIAGFNHHFGRKGDAGFERIRQCAESFKIVTEQVPGFRTSGEVVSSSLIREALLNGEPEKARLFLGYDYFLNGTVVEGKHLGKEIGFPTANIEPDYKRKLIPKTGIYAVEIIVDGQVFKGMMSIGTNPTVNDDPMVRTIEVNIFDFDKEIYNSKLCVVFRHRMRDEIKFRSVPLLIEQLKLDKKMALRLLAG